MNTRRDPSRSWERRQPAGKGWTRGPARFFRVVLVRLAVAVVVAMALTPVVTAADLYWVQVGVFRDADAAKRVAQRLRERKYHVQEMAVPARGAAPPPAGGGDGAAASRAPQYRYEVVVAGGGSGEAAAKLSAKGLASRASADGAVITPSLPLSEAVALSRELTNDGLPVRVRRVAAPGSPLAAAVASSGSVAAPPAGETLHRVRVGGFTDRAAALATLRELEELGYKPFLAQASE